MHMHLKKLHLINYKNFESADFDFESKFNCLVGNNGMGKTNVLDSIYHLAFGKSYFNPVSLQNIRHGEDFFVIEGDFKIKDVVEKIVVGMRKGQKKTLKRNGKIYDKFSDHLGLIPLVIISPADRDLITEGSDLRRKFIDSVIAQSDKDYLQKLLRYHKLLDQRNALLKYFAANRTFDAQTLGVYNQQMADTGTVIFQKRKAFINDFVKIFNEQYAAVSQGNEAIKLVYQSQLTHTELLQLFEEHIDKDKIVQYTTQGIHKDDLDFLIDNVPIKKFGSQGQQKTFLIALKLAQFHFLAGKSGVTPILLLDDIFDKLDDSRVNRLVELVNTNDFGQIFISDTHPERTENILKRTGRNYTSVRL